MLENLILNVIRLPNCYRLPIYATSGSAGLDLSAANGTDLEIAPNCTVEVSTGIILQIPTGFEGQIRSRSGLALNGIVVANGVGTIDSDFRREIVVLLYNRSTVMFPIKSGDRIAQLVVSKVSQVSFLEVDTLEDPGSRESGFGSTGLL